MLSALLIANSTVESDSENLRISLPGGVCDLHVVAML